MIYAPVCQSDKSDENVPGIIQGSKEGSASSMPACRRCPEWFREKWLANTEPMTDEHICHASGGREMPALEEPNDERTVKQTKEPNY